MLTLLLLCHQCGREFPSSVSLSEHGIRGQLLDGVIYECPYCGIRDPYFTAEHHLPQSGGFALARSSGPRWSAEAPPPPPRYSNRRVRLGARRGCSGDSLKRQPTVGATPGAAAISRSAKRYRGTVTAMGGDGDGSAT